ncbi:MAG: hypothetical protein PUP91_21250 [Rhizonema sp. PD37]|nr:hypothetical protein [Rhizonema sp. PD37]
MLYLRQKAAEAIIQIVENDNPPLRLVLRSDAVHAIAQKPESVKAQLDAWKQVSPNIALE